MSNFVYEPPRENLPAGVGTGVVFGSIKVAVDDGADPGISTDVIPATGYIEFVPQTSHISWNDTLYVLKTRRAYLDSRGQFSIDLVASIGTAPVNNWTYKVNYHLNEIDMKSFEFTVPSGSNRPLDTLTPRINLAQSVVVKGDKGEKGDMSIVGLNVFVDSDGDLAIDDTRRWYWGSGSPNGVVPAGVGSYYDDLSAAGSNFLYRKTTATGNTGWVVVK